MASELQDRWIVLLDKSPKGPLTKEEIQALLERGILRRNDLAYQIPYDADAKARTEWKLLWQFPQFDRRGPESHLSKTAVERRQTKSSDQITESIAVELRDIAPEELVSRPSKGPSPWELAPEEPSPSPTSQSYPEIPVGVRWGFFGLLTVFVASVVWWNYTGPTVPPKVATTTSLAEPSQALESRPVAAIRKPANQVMLPQAQDREPIPFSNAPDLEPEDPESVVTEELDPPAPKPGKRLPPHRPSRHRPDPAAREMVRSEDPEGPDQEEELVEEPQPETEEPGNSEEQDTVN